MTDMRLPPAAANASRATTEAEAQIIKSRGKISPLYQLLLHSPPIATGWEALLTAVRRKSALAASLREMVILRVAVLNKAPYEFDAHTPLAREAGLSDAKILALGSGSLQPFDAREILVLEYCDVMTQQIHVSDELFARIRQQFDETGIVELTATIAAYNMVSRFLEALHVR
ncbi:MAG: carboxymuconolactone decarboxylase family protein [Pseudomonadota bacterium]